MAFYYAVNELGYAGFVGDINGEAFEGRPSRLH
jgi:hypothetical protein